MARQRLAKPTDHRAGAHGRDGNASDPNLCVIVRTYAAHGRALAVLLQSLFTAWPTTVYAFIVNTDRVLGSFEADERELLKIRNYARLHAPPDSIHMLRLRPTWPPLYKYAARSARRAPTRV